jgi:hypothetical protein
MWGSRAISYTAGVLVYLLCACGNSESAQSGTQAAVPAQQATIDVCTLLTSAEIESALGWKVATTESKSYGETGSCTYASATPYSAQGLQQLAVLVGFGAPELASSEAMAEWRLAQYSDDSYKDLNPLVLPVEGLGVPAIQNGLDGSFGIELLVDGKLLTLSLFETLEPARTLAEKAMARMD